MERGKQIKLSIDLAEQLFLPKEGYNAVYYGKVRNGKSRNATADILELLKRGEKVIANWHINFDGYDERENKMVVLLKTIFNRSLFFKYDAENLKFMDPSELISGKGEVSIEYLNRLVGWHIFIDEGQWVMPSMDKTWDKDNIEKMKLVLHGGHYCRSLNIITQRPNNISKNTRSQINVWYRCVKMFDMFGIMIFQRWGIQDMKDDMPVEFDEEKRPAGELKTYIVNTRTDQIFKSYDTHAMRGSDAIDFDPLYEVYELTWRDKLSLLFKRSNKVNKNG